MRRLLLAAGCGTGTDGKPVASPTTLEMESGSLVAPPAATGKV